jgi:hypothetical protein
MTVRLWKRNAIGAVVAAAAAVVSMEFIVQPAWERYARTITPAHTAAAGLPVTVDGQTWTVRNVSRSTRQPGSGAPLPDGTVLVNLVVQRSGPAEAGFSCVGYLIDGERTWRATGMPCGAETSMRWSFFVPATAEPTAVDITKPDRSILIRLYL